MRLSGIFTSQRLVKIPDKPASRSFRERSGLGFSMMLAPKGDNPSREATASVTLRIVPRAARVIDLRAHLA